VARGLKPLFAVRFRLTKALRDVKQQSRRTIGQRPCLSNKIQLRGAGILLSCWLFGFQNPENIDEDLLNQLYYDRFWVPRSRDRRQAAANEIQLCVREYAQITHDSLLGLANLASRSSGNALRPIAR
jgi:hypothetical protein